MANSALQPLSDSDVRTSQTPSQLPLNPAPEPLEVVVLRPRRPSPAFTTCPSYSCPAGLVPKTKPLWRSRKVSRMNCTLSPSSSDASRRLSAIAIDPGLRS